MDLLPYVKFDLDYFRRGVEALNPCLAFFGFRVPLAKGFEAWVD